MSCYSISMFTQKLEVSRMVRSCILPRAGAQFAHVSQLREALDVTHGGRYGLCGHMKVTQYFLAIRFVISIFSRVLLSFFAFFFLDVSVRFFCFLQCPSFCFGYFFVFTPQYALYGTCAPSRHIDPHRAIGSYQSLIFPYNRIPIYICVPRLIVLNIGHIQGI